VILINNIYILWGWNVFSFILSNEI